MPPACPAVDVAVSDGVTPRTIVVGSLVVFTAGLTVALWLLSDVGGPERQAADGAAAASSASESSSPDPDAGGTEGDSDGAPTTSLATTTSEPGAGPVVAAEAAAGSSRAGTTPRRAGAGPRPTTPTEPNPTTGPAGADPTNGTSGEQDGTATDGDDGGPGTPGGDTSPPGDGAPAPTPPGGETPAPPQPDEESLAFLRRGLWNVPEDDTRCGWEGAGTKAPGTLFGRWQDASDDGDFFVVCLTTEAVPAWPLELVVADPSGTEVARATVRASTGSERVSGRTVTPLLVGTAETSRYNGLTVAPEDGRRHISQLHLWLPHDRTPGGWTVTLDGRTARVAVRDWCATGPPSSPDPLVWADGIAFARNGFGDDVRRHCLARPDVVGLPRAEARTLVGGVLTLLGASTTTPSEFERCSSSPRGTIIDLTPDPWPIGPVAFDPGTRTALIVSSGPCPAATSTGTGDR